MLFGLKPASDGMKRVLNPRKLKRLSVKLLQLRHYLSYALLAEPIDHVKTARSPLILLMLVIHTEDQFRDDVAVCCSMCPDVSRLWTKTFKEELACCANNTGDSLN